MPKSDRPPRRRAFWICIGVACFASLLVVAGVRIWREHFSPDAEILSSLRKRNAAEAHAAIAATVSADIELRESTWAEIRRSRPLALFLRRKWMEEPISLESWEFMTLINGRELLSDEEVRAMESPIKANVRAADEETREKALKSYRTFRNLYPES